MLMIFYTDSKRQQIRRDLQQPTALQESENSLCVSITNKETECLRPPPSTLHPL